MKTSAKQADVSSTSPSTDSYSRAGASQLHDNFLGENCWAEAPIKIARMTLTIKLDGNWSSFQLANSAPPLSVTDSAIAPSARMIIWTSPVKSF